MSNSPAFDPSIPVLTEVFQDQPVRQELPPQVGDAAGAAANAGTSSGTAGSGGGAFFSTRIGIGSVRAFRNGSSGRPAGCGTDGSKYGKTMPGTFVTDVCRGRSW